ncbi:hypothetical protein H9Q74_000011 [Fusarium xylarioides]|nr:hypothetical protein H9Q71_000165 [Fusarium xylarioides]KAG5829858.1 hypothetical protein H9Q74_000011 [Fusarium xylarioides]
MSAANETALPTRRRRLKADDIDESLVPIVEAILRSHPVVTLDEMTDIIQDGDNIINDDWSQAEEDEIEAEWQASGRKISSDHVGTRLKNDDPLRDLWRVCVRFFRQTPPVLLSEYNWLQFVPKIVKGSFRLSCDLFTKDACHAIADLIVHPIWGQDHRPFIEALIYAANCRVGRTRNFGWLVNPDEPCPALQSLNAILDANTNEQLPRTVHQLHTEARVTVLARGEISSLFSDLIYRVGEAARAERSLSDYEKDLLQRKVFPFKMADLDCIKQAIDGLASSDDVRVGYSVKTMSDAFKVLKSDEVPARDQLHNRSRATTRDLQRDADRSRSPRLSHGSARTSVRARSRSQLPPDVQSTRQQRTPLPSSANYPDQDIHRVRSPSRDQHGFDHDGFMPDLDDTGETPIDPMLLQNQEDRRTREPLGPARLAGDGIASQFASADEMKQVRESIEHLKTEHRDAIIGLNTQHTKAIEALKSEHGTIKSQNTEKMKAQERLIDELKAKLDSRDTGDQSLSERLSRLEAKQSQQTELIKFLQQENKRLSQAVRPTSRARTPTPVDRNSHQPEEPSQRDGMRVGDLSAYPQGFSFPSILQTPIPVSSRESFQGPALRRRNQDLRIEEGYGDRAVDVHKKNR